MDELRNSTNLIYNKNVIETIKLLDMTLKDNINKDIISKDELKQTNNNKLERKEKFNQKIEESLHNYKDQVKDLTDALSSKTKEFKHISIDMQNRINKTKNDVFTLQKILEELQKKIKDIENAIGYDVNK